MPVYKRGNVYWCAFMLHGRRIRRSTKQTKKSSAEWFEAQLKAEAMNRGSLVKNSNIRLKDFWGRFSNWLDEAVAAGSLKAKTRRYYRVGWKQVESTDLAFMYLTQVDKSVVAGTTFKGGAAYKNQAIRTVRRMLGMAKEWRLLAEAPSLRLYHEQPRESVIDPTAETALLAHCDPATKLALILMQDCGIRRDEVARMRLDWVRWKEQVLCVPDGKTRNAKREVPLSKRSYDALLMAHAGRIEGFVFPSKRAKCGHIHPDTLSDGFRAARKSAGLPDDVVLYSARHTFGTAIYGATGNLKLVMKVMGHGDARTAMRYQHPSMESVRAVINERNGQQKEAVN